MSLNANVTAVCPTPSCGHDYKVTPLDTAEGIDHTRAFVGNCANCGAAETFFLFDAEGLDEFMPEKAAPKK